MEEFLVTKEAAKYIGISRTRFCTYRNQGYNFMQPTKIEKGKMYYSKEQLDTMKIKLKALREEGNKNKRLFMSTRKNKI